MEAVHWTIGTTLDRSITNIFTFIFGKAEKEFIFAAPNKGMTR